MHRVEALEALTQRKDSALLLDRRADRVGKLPGAEIERAWVLIEPGGDAKIHASLLRFRDPQSVPRELYSDHGGCYVRRMDRFFLPEVTDPAVTGALFDFISELYERLTFTKVNVDTAAALLASVVRHGVAEQRILDFGCGTGLAVVASLRLNEDVTLVGTDLSPRMLELAAKRGEIVIPLPQWRTDPKAFDGAICSFVLHYGVPDSDLALVAKRLRPGARFAANYFKAKPDQVEMLVRTLEMNGLILERTFQIPTALVESDMALVFKKQNER